MRREELDACIHCAGALLEPKVRVVKDDEANQADETVEPPDDERGPEPVGDPEGGCEETSK